MPQKKTTFGPRETQRIQARRKKWIDALLSGEFEQGKKRLAVLDTPNNSYCCLGVAEKACKLSPLHKNEIAMLGKAMLPGVSLRKLGITSSIGFDLARLNDHENRSFEYIAGYIEALPIVRED